MKRLIGLFIFAALSFAQAPIPSPIIGGSGGGGGGTGTVTSVATGCGISGGTITTTGTIKRSEAVNAQTGTTYTILDGDCGKLISGGNASSQAYTLPQANGSTFISGWLVDIENTGAGTLTITPTTSTIDGAASLALTTNQGVRIVSDGTNYFTQRGVGGGGSGVAPYVVPSITASPMSISAATHGQGAYAFGNCYDAGYVEMVCGWTSDASGNLTLTYTIAPAHVYIFGSIGSTTIANTTNLISGNGSGSGVDSGIAAANVVTAASTLTNDQLLFGAGTKASAVGDLTGDITTSGSKATTLATVNSNTGSCGDSTHVCQVTLNAKGLATAASAVAISGSGGSPTFPTNAKTSTYQVLAADFSACKEIPVASGTFTITLVASGTQPTDGQCIFINNYGSGVVTVARSGQNINGGTTSLSLTAGTATAPTGAFITSDGTNYFALLFGMAGAASGVSSFGGATGAVTVGKGIAVSSNVAIGSVSVNPQTGTTYTVVDGDCQGLITSSNSSAATLYTLPQAGSGGNFASGCVITIKNLHATGLVEVDTSTSTFLGAAQSTRTYLMPKGIGTYTSNGTDWIFEQTGPRILCNSYSVATADILGTDGGNYNTTAAGGAVAATNAGTTETAFGKTCTIPANMITTSTMLRVTFNLIHTSTSGSTPTHTYKFRTTNASGTTFMATPAIAQAATAITANTEYISFTLAGTAAPGGSVAVYVAEAGTGNGGDTRQRNTLAPTALATNAAIIVATTLTFSAATAGNSVALAGLTVEVVSF